MSPVRRPEIMKILGAQASLPAMLRYIASKQARCLRCQGIFPGARELWLQLLREFFWGASFYRRV